MPHDIKLTRGIGSLRDFISGMLAPVQTLTAQMKIFGDRYLQRAAYNGRKMVLQAALNDEFDITEAPFIIVETIFGGATPLHFFEPSELQPVYFSEVSENDPVYFSESTEATAITTDFIIKIPISRYTAELARQVAAETTLFKLAGKTFTIVTY